MLKCILHVQCLMLPPFKENVENRPHMSNIASLFNQVSLQSSVLISNIIIQFDVFSANNKLFCYSFVCFNETKNSMFKNLMFYFGGSLIFMRLSLTIIYIDIIVCMRSLFTISCFGNQTSRVFKNRRIFFQVKKLHMCHTTNKVTFMRIIILLCLFLFDKFVVVYKNKLIVDQEHNV